MSKVRWDSFDRVVVIITPTGASDLLGTNYGTFADVGPGLTKVRGMYVQNAPSTRHGAIVFNGMEARDYNTWETYTPFLEPPAALEVAVELFWGDTDPLTADIELRLMDSAGNDVSAGLVSVSRAMATETRSDGGFFLLTFNTSELFETGDSEGGAEGNYLYRTGSFPGINLPPPEPLPPIPPPPSNRPSGGYTPYRPPSGLSDSGGGGAPRTPQAPPGYELMWVCEESDSISVGHGDRYCYYKAVKKTNIYYFKDWKDYERNYDRYQGRDSFKDPKRAGL